MGENTGLNPVIVVCIGRNLMVNPACSAQDIQDDLAIEPSFGYRPELKDIKNILEVLVSANFIEKFNDTLYTLKYKNEIKENKKSPSFSDREIPLWQNVD